MNQYDIEDALRAYGDDPDEPVLGRAARTLYNVMEWTDRNSDGWPYWPKPARAAAGLITMLEQARRSRFDLEPYSPTEADYQKALRPVKAFRTRQSADFLTADEEAEKTERDRVERKQAAEARLEELRAAIRAESISYGEIAELADLSEYIEPGDVELEEWAGIPESGVAVRPVQA